LGALQRRFRQGQIGIRGDELLLGGKIGCGCAVYRGSRLGVVNDGQHLTLMNAISFVNPDFDDVPHHLTREIAGLGSAHSPYRFEHIGYVGLFYGEHGKVSHGFRG
jgi:hypothetical protein